MNNSSLIKIVAPMLTSILSCSKPSEEIVINHPKEVRSTPNILFVIADDQSFPHCSAYGNSFVKTPAFDYIASQGCLFQNAYVTSPGSSPSRASILSGMYPWQIKEAGTHCSYFPKDIVCYTDILTANGYNVGYTGKGWAPGDCKERGVNPAGKAFNKKKLTPPYSGISNIDYVENFKLFYQDSDKKQPFCFWVGFNEPHRGFERDSWQKENKSLSVVSVPGFLPNHDVVKGDLLDYSVEIEYQDAQLQKIIDFLKEKGLFDNTLIIVTADNGMAFPNAKATCYDAGVHVPLAICWGDKIKRKNTSEIVSSVDFAPTMLDAAGINRSSYGHMSGKSMLPFLMENKEQKREAVYFGRERHSSSRYANLGYPIRSLRKGNYLYIRNFHPERWPAGDPTPLDKNNNLAKAHSGYFDIDGSPTKQFFINNRENGDGVQYFIRTVGFRPYEELYNIENDPCCLDNCIEKPEYKGVLSELRGRLDQLLYQTNDVRVTSEKGDSIWESYPRIDSIRNFPPYE